MRNMNKYDLKTPCYILDENEFIHNITCFHKELASKFKNHIIGYSFKTNSLPRLLQLVKEQGFMAEVVSIAKKIGVIASEMYFYRRRNDNSSAIQTSNKNYSFFFVNPLYLK